MMPIQLVLLAHSAATGQEAATLLQRTLELARLSMLGRAMISFLSLRATLLPLLQLLAKVIYLVYLKKKDDLLTFPCIFLVIDDWVHMF